MEIHKTLRNLIRLAPIVAALFFAAGAAAQTAQSAQAIDDTRTEVAGRWKSPEQVYDKICAKCHDTGIAPAIKGRQLASQMTIVMVRVGPGAMPAFRQTDVDDAMLKRLGEMIESSEAPPNGNPEKK
jgi:mono/diheme cytochrome c family protein